MPRLGATVADLTILGRLREAAAWPIQSLADTSLMAIEPTGLNPGQLKMSAMVPPGLPRGAPLVVVLHGCLQNAAGFDAGAGWSMLARRHGFALLYPEQLHGNNANGCFNWFQPDDVTRGHGEVASIAGMIDQMLASHTLDPARVYITGLSAGGAMTAAMLATYPELFAGGAIIAGLPFGSATTIAMAFEAMRRVRIRPAAEWGSLIREASPPTALRPNVQLWHGAADAVVTAPAMEEAAKQWQDALGLVGGPVRDTIDGTAHAAWTARDGRVMLETYLLPGVGHGVPLHSQSPDLDESVGMAGAYMLEAGVGSTHRIAASWGLLTQAARPRSVGRPAASQKGPDFIGGLVHGALKAAGIKI